MRKLFIFCLAAIQIFAACNSSDKKTNVQVPEETKQIDTTGINKPEEPGEPEQLYACPMHPEVKGRKDTKCHKCGMKLTEPVKKNETQ